MPLLRYRGSITELGKQYEEFKKRPVTRGQLVKRFFVFSFLAFLIFLLWDLYKAVPLPVFLLFVFPFYIIFLTVFIFVFLILLWSIFSFYDKKR